MRTLESKYFQYVAGGNTPQKPPPGIPNDSGAEWPPIDNGTNDIKDGVSELDSPWHERFTGVGSDCDQSNLPWHERVTPVTCLDPEEPLPEIKFEDAFKF